jgi:hypothetical protein
MPLAQVIYAVERRYLIPDIFSRNDLTSTVLFFASCVRRMRPRVSGSWSGNNETDMLGKERRDTDAKSQSMEEISTVTE